MRTSNSFMASLLALASSSVAQIVETANGAIQGGKCSRTDSRHFVGIPYAQPPVGELRLKAPRPFTASYNGTFNATVAPPSCIQFNELFAESNTQSEDCYRTGPLGFLALSSLGLEGNFGIQDQLLGLQWVQENIAAFGGDNTKVLLFGQSAGATDAYVLSTLPQAPKLFSAAALESGGGRDPATPQKVQSWQQHFLDALNCSSSDLSCVLSASADDFTAADSAMPSEIAPGATTPFNREGARATWGPVFDGQVIPELPTKAGNQVPAIFGFNAAEGTLFVFGEYLADTFKLNQSDYDDFLTYNFGPLAPKVNETYSVDKFNSSQYPYFAAMSTILGQVSYKCPAYRALLASEKNGVPAWTYEFSHEPSCAWYASIPYSILSYVGATHTAEIPFVFNTTHNMPLPGGNCTFTTAEQSLAAAMSEAWTSMADSGSPGAKSDWPQWTGNSSAGVNIDVSMVVGTVDYKSCLFWDAIYDESVKIVG
ncbi:hypothetical protein TruAng_000412 [Truncatella angustata]|nr:hypothetical protein TruAng_000412 [Truncatella angustata]